jgi:hypothetical protein
VSTETLSLIVAGLAVAVGPGVTYWLGVRRFDHEQKLADQQDARAVLVQGAEALWVMKNTMRDQLTAFDKALRDGADWPEDTLDRIGELEAKRDAVEAALDVLRIRFAGSNSTVTAYTEAWKAVKGVITVYFLASQESDHGREPYNEAMGLSFDFDRKRDEYLSAAQRAVGVALSD